MGQVLGLEVVELAGALRDVHPDLPGLGHARGGVAVTAQDRDLDLAAEDPGLDQDLGIHLTGGPNGGGQVLGAVDLADTQGGAGAGGLDEQGVGQGGARLKDGGRVVVPCAGGDHHVRGGGDARGVQEHLGDLLVHAGGTGQHPAAHVGQAHHLQQALDGAVLPVGAVQQGQDDVDGPQQVRAGGGDGAQRPAARAHGQLAASQARGRDLHRRLVPAQLQGCGVVVHQDPLALPGHANGQDVVAPAVNGGQDPGGGGAGDGVLPAAAPEDDGDARPAPASRVRVRGGGDGEGLGCVRHSPTLPRRDTYPG